MGVASEAEVEEGEVGDAVVVVGSLVLRLLSFLRCSHIADPSW